jgi:hypothetical protein
LRRIIILGAAVAVLAAASIAVAAANVNSYSASIAFKPTKAGSKHKPVSVGFTETYTAANNTAGNRAAPLINITTKIYGLINNGSKFPTCDGNKISAQRTDSFCPKKALVATGPVNAKVGDTTLNGPGSPCNPFLHVWNGGKGKLWFFFTTGGPYQCFGLKTGATAAYPGFVRQQGKYEVTDVPLPPDVSTNVAGIGLYGSLIREVLTFKNTTIKKGGKTYALNASVGCQNGKRPYSVSFTATTPSGNQAVVEKAAAKC